jgi:diphthamide biosynthesis protein 2
LKSLILAHHKKPYLISVGKPNPAKLSNFLEIDAFVLVACPENTLLDSKEFLRPVVSPFELECAIVKGRYWNPREFETDLGVLAPRLGEAVDKVGGDEYDDDDEPHFSLATGGFKKATRYASAVRSTGDNDDSNEQDDADGSNEGGTIAIRHGGGGGTLSKYVVRSAASEYLNSQRTYKGLEIKKGMDASGDREEKEGAQVQEGRSGVASGYSHESREMIEQD